MVILGDYGGFFFFVHTTKLCVNAALHDLSREAMRLFPSDRHCNAVHASSPSTSVMRLEKRERSVSLVSFVRPCILVMLLNDKSSHSR